MSMEAILQNSTDFILLGLITHPAFPGIIFAVVFSIFLVAVTANVVMILLIHVDSHLHTPMYFLLSQLSIMDTVYICITVPKMLQDLLSKEKMISFLGCSLQIFLYLTLIGGEFFLLGLMAYDRYVAVCKPLRYPLLMNRRICLFMVVSKIFIRLIIPLQGCVLISSFHEISVSLVSRGLYPPIIYKINASN